MPLARSGKAKSLLVFALSIAAAGATLETARADFYLHHWEDHFEPTHQLSLEGDLLVYSTQMNYDSNSNLYTPQGLDNYKRIELDLNVAYGIADRLTLFGRFGWARASMDTSSVSSASYGATDQTVGIGFRAYRTPLQLDQWTPSSFDLQLQTDFPGYQSTPPESPTPALGDHSVDVTPGGFVTIPAWQDSEKAITLVGGAGYTFRFGRFSAQIPWTLAANYLQKTRGIVGTLALFGMSSLKTDNTSLTQTSPGNYATGSGGSFITDAVNPESSILRAEVGYLFQPGKQAMLAYESTLWGKNAPASGNIWVGYRTTLGQKSANSPSEGAETGLAEYSLEAKVLRVNDRLNLVKIDKGSADGVEKDQIFDIFSTSADGSAVETVARAKVTGVKSNEAALTILEYFKEVWINEGFIAKRLLQ